MRDSSCREAGAEGTDQREQRIARPERSEGHAQILYHYQNIENMPALSKELAKAILMMPQPERDKLLLRLIGKDEKLVLKLAFELLEGTANDVEVRRNNLSERLKTHMNAPYLTYASPGMVMMAMRGTSGEITEHVRVTKDKFGDIMLNLQLIIATFKRFGEMFSTTRNDCDKITAYIIKKILDIFVKIQRLHPDMLLDFKEDLNTTLSIVHSHKMTSKAAKAVNLPLEV